MTEKGGKIIYDFFITFSRFECALKNSITYVKPNNGKVEADWVGFIKSIENDFDKNKNKQLKEAVEFILNDPPKYQILEDKTLKWKVRSLEGVSEVKRLLQHIKDIRNNLFHGGKFNGNYQSDISRNFNLLKSSIIILDNWLILNKEVEQNFSEKID